MNTTILVVDDEPQIRKFLQISLGANGYDVDTAENGDEAVVCVQKNSPDLLVLDLGLPGLDGQDVISAIRSFSDIPILVLSVRSSELDKVEALERGADDYVVKPFGIAELVARVRALLRHRRSTTAGVSDQISLGTLRLDLSRREVVRDGTVIKLSRREWSLLVFLARNADRVLTHRHILREVWGPAHVEDTAYLRVYINQLRQKLEDNPAKPTLIVTDPGVGYRILGE